jgi:hypothetical protein
MFSSPTFSQFAEVDLAAAAARVRELIEEQAYIDSPAGMAAGATLPPVIHSFLAQFSSIIPLDQSRAAYAASHHSALLCALLRLLETRLSSSPAPARTTAKDRARADATRKALARSAREETIASSAVARLRERRIAPDRQLSRVETLLRHGEAAETKRKQLRAAADADEKKALTLAPEINAQSRKIAARVQPLHERTAQLLEAKQKRLDTQRAQEATAASEGLTFKPEINAASRALAPHSTDMDKWAVAREQKLKALRSQAEEAEVGAGFKPHINDRSRKLAERRSKRASANPHGTKPTFRKSVAPLQPTFCPDINPRSRLIKSDQPVSERLFEEARKQRERAEQRRQEALATEQRALASRQVRARPAPESDFAQASRRRVAAPRRTGSGAAGALGSRSSGRFDPRPHRTGTDTGVSTRAGAGGPRVLDLDEDPSYSYSDPSGYYSDSYSYSEPAGDWDVNHRELATLAAALEAAAEEFDE